MSSENLHAPRERLSPQTLNLHFAIVSLMEELDAIDWYRQRADDAEDERLKGLLLHNMREEMEHCRSPIETSPASPIEMSRSSVCLRLIEVAWDDGDHDELQRTDAPAGADRCR
jgi:hypothetical protein